MRLVQTDIHASHIESLHHRRDAHCPVSPRHRMHTVAVCTVEMHQSDRLFPFHIPMIIHCSLFNRYANSAQCEEDHTCLFDASEQQKDAEKGGEDAQCAGSQALKCTLSFPPISSHLNHLPCTVPYASHPRLSVYTYRAG
jgi:hypothetical protein